MISPIRRCAWLLVGLFPWLAVAAIAGTTPLDLTAPDLPPDGLTFEAEHDGLRRAIVLERHSLLHESPVP